jgi:hypothetical protein
MMVDVQEYLLLRGGSASSDVLVRHFTDKVPTARMALFKFVLKELCLLRKGSRGGAGVWQLRPEYQTRVPFSPTTVFPGGINPS